MLIEKIKLDDLSLDPANARKHPDRNLETIVASLRRFGQQKPIVIDRNNIVRAGNGTLEAAKRLGWETIDCVRTDLNGSEATAYAIADNRTAELAEWDDDILASALNGLALDDGLLQASGFNNEELQRLIKEVDIEPELVEKKVMAPPKMSWVLLGIPTVRFGEISADIERLSSISDLICETTSNDG